MISAQILDAGTYPLIDYTISIPGMDSFYWNEGDFETDNLDSRQNEINAIIRAAGELSIEPWPSALTNHAPMDRTPRYEARGDEGFFLNLYRHDLLTGENPIAPAGEARLDLDDFPTVDPNAARLTREFTWREEQENAEDPAAWIRLDSYNVTGGTRLKEPLSMQWRGLNGAEYRIEIPDQTLFAPVDLRYPSRYYALTDAGIRLPDDQGERAMALLGGGRYRIYVRPRKWRYVATVIAHYLLISPFEVVPMDEWFIRAHTHRPPFYPYRHDILTTSQNPTLPNYFGDLRSYDEGVNFQWEHSRSAGELAREVIEGQYYTLCLVKLFVRNEDADVTISRRPPDTGDIVLGIGRIDQATGRETRTWIVQRDDLTHLYPWTVISQNLVPFRVIPESRETIIR